MESSTAVNNDTTNLSFAAKIDYLQPAGAYATTLQFNIVANPLVTYMQNMDSSICVTDAPATVVDKRDNNEYTIQRLADGQCWMISNLNLPGGTSLYSSDSDVPAGYDNTPYYTLPASSTTGFDSDTGQYVYNSGNITTSQSECTASKPCNSYYSWLVAVAGNQTNVTGNGYNVPYSICPKGWRLPTATTSNANPTANSNWKTGDLYKLATAYGANLGSSHFQNAATFYNNAGPGTTPNFLLAGSYSGSSFRNGNSWGYYYSSSSSNASASTYSLLFSKSYVYTPNLNSKRSGFSLRCLLR